MLDFPPDFTFVIQLVGFFVLMAILNKLLFAPFIEVINEREARTEGAAAHAVEGQDEANTLKAKIDAEMAEARREAATIADSIRRDGRAKEAEIYERGKLEAASKLAELRAGIESERVSAETELRDSAKALAASMVESILGDGRA
jgi:F-type H+-transporting ATPase subunit b